MFMVFLCTFWSLKIFSVISWKRATSTSFKMHPSVFHRKSATFLEPIFLLFFMWTITLEIFWATTCAVDTARLHNCKQVTTATSCNSEIQSHVSQSDPPNYVLQNTFHKLMKKKKKLVGLFAQAETALGPVEVHLGVWPRLEGWPPIPNTVPIQLPYDLKWLNIL